MNRSSSVIKVAVVAIVIFTGVTWAETPMRIGAKAGLNVATLSGDGARLEERSYPPETTTGGIGGIFLNIELSPNLSLQTELNYSQKGADWETTSNDDFGTLTLKMDADVDYLELAFLATYSVPTGGKLNPFVLAGPTIAFKVSSGATAELTRDSAGVVVPTPPPSKWGNIENAKSTSFEMVLGAGAAVNIGANRLSLEGRYSFSLVQPFDDGYKPDELIGDDYVLVNDYLESPSRHSVFSILVGFSLPL